MIEGSNSEGPANTPELTPRYCALKLDQTRYWTDEIVARAKKIFSVYLFDANKHVHCCEFTPSYECLFVESQYDNPALPDREADRLSVDLLKEDAASDPVRYFHCWEIDGLPRIKEGEPAQGVIDLEIDNEEEALEYVRHRGI
jgi:hypothetical protein